MHKGARVENGDYFDDRLTSKDGGILQSDGLTDYDGIDTKLTENGYEVTRNCSACGVKRKITLEFHEMFQVGSNRPGIPVLLPKDWEFSPNNGTAFVNLPCNHCGQKGLAVHVTPQEAQKVYTSAADSGLIPKAAIMQHQQQMLMMRQQHRR